MSINVKPEYRLQFIVLTPQSSESECSSNNQIVLKDQVPICFILFTS